MVLTLSRIRGARRRCSIALRAALLVGMVVYLHSLAVAQTQGSSGPVTTENGPAPALKTSAEKAPLSDTERTELLKLIKSLQERIEKLEAAQASTANAAASNVPAAATPVAEPENWPEASGSVRDYGADAAAQG